MAALRKGSCIPLGWGLFLLAACAPRSPGLAPFASDGCSLFPDRDYASGESWCDCCVDHDYAYWKGGSDGARQLADRALGDCILKRTGDSALAEAVYLGTRAGGLGRLPTWYRWGYGWPYRSEGISDSVRAEAVREKGAVDLAGAKRKVCGEKVR